MDLSKLSRLLRPQPAPHNVEGLALDYELAARIREGDRAALERLVERHLPRVNRYVHHRLGPGHDDLAWSVVTATFDEALRELGPYARNATATPMEFWLLRLAERHLGKQRRPPRKPNAPELPPATEKEGEELAIVRSALDTLPRRHASVLALALFEGLTAEGIAYTLKMGQARAMKRLRAALRQMGKRLAAATSEVES
jgi:RNA polymerase sigma-70 factor, ECF subfamily